MIEVLAYLDDVNMLGKTFEDHLQNLYNVLQRFRKYILKLKPELFKSNVDVLGRVVSREEVTINPKDVEVVHKWPTPKNSKDLEKSMGF